MADDSAKPAEGAELSKEVLAPAEGPRENLVVTAVKFLQNPKVRQSPLSQKKAFLESKGLTSDEIQLAVQRAGVTDDVSSSQAVQLPPSQPQHPAAYANSALVPVQQHLPPPLPISPWTKTREMVTTAAIIAAVSYAVYNIFKTYIRPWLMGKSESEKRLERLEASIAQLQTSVADSSAQMVETLKALQESLAQQNDKNVQSSEVSVRQESFALNEIKSEVSSLKALLLSRRQFPPPPATAPIIPAWQKQSEQTPSLTAQSEGGASQGTSPAANTQANMAPAADTSMEKEKTEGDEGSGEALSVSEERVSFPESGRGEGAVAMSPSSNNGFEMVKTTSDSDTPPDLD